MKDDNILSSESDPLSARDYSTYIQLATDIYDEFSRGRTGFGAFRHFPSIFQETVRLVLESSFLASPQKQEVPIWFLDDDWFHFHFMKRYPGSHKHFINRLLTTPASYDPSCLWALFWSLAKAEHEFLTRYIPFWSHEERLTGHLISQLVERIESFSTHWASLNGSNDTQSENQCRIFYADTATARRESLTGADFGLVVQARFGKQQEYFKVARFQAKKVDRSGKARIDLDQVEALLARQNLGYYIFYHWHDQKEWGLPPTVLRASQFEHHLKEFREKKPISKSQELGTESFAARENGFDFAAFITFALTDQASEHGVYVLDAEEAVRTLMSSNQPLEQPSRILIVTLGANTTAVDWNDLLHQYIGTGQ